MIKEHLPNSIPNSDQNTRCITTHGLLHGILIEKNSLLVYEVTDGTEDDIGLEVTSLSGAFRMKLDGMMWDRGNLKML